MSLGQRISLYRKQSGMSQEKVAEYIGISRQAVTKWENDRSAPSTENLIRLAELYNISLNDLVSDKEEPENDEIKSTTENQAKPWLWMPITLYSAALCSWGIVTYDITDGIPVRNDYLYFLKAIPVIIFAVWMAINIMSDKNVKRRAKNAKIELLFCLIQYSIGMLGKLFIGNILSAILITLCCIFYLKTVNPKWMGRQLFNPNTNTKV